MKTITENSQQVDIYDIEDFPYDNFRDVSTVERSKRSKKKYVDLVCAFDIETTTITADKCSYFGNDFGFMYVWQFACEKTVCLGRTWEEYKIFIERLCEAVDCDGRKLVVYVHNLAFEFQFMRDFFDVGKVFCRSKRGVVYAEMGDVEYRCSYILSNMGLNKFLEKSKGVTFYKADGKKFNYSKLRYPDTELTDEELWYCVCDVLGLVEAIHSKLVGDDLSTIPITSTGYVRRDFRDAMNSAMDMRDYMKSLRLHERTYTLCTEASRGAISGSNHVYTECILEDVDSEDIKSSYPYQMATKYFPMSKFVRYRALYGTEKFYSLLRNYCCIIVWSCNNIKLKQWSGIPYISKAKCRAIEGAKCGNGKVYSAKRIGMCCTEIDFEIIMNHYKVDEGSVVIHEIWCAHRGMLPKPFRETLLHMFQMKTDLEDGEKFIYIKYKNKINASFGMMLTNILHSEYLYIPESTEPWKEVKVSNVEKALDDYYKAGSSFLHYQHGVWVLAHGRSDLVAGMDAVGQDIVQVDTDSVKHLEDHKRDFERINLSIIEKAETYDVKPYSIKDGHKHYLGVWEHEGEDGRPTYHKFKTLGAKKYAEEKEDGSVHITVAGLSKEAGEYFRRVGGLDKFSIGHNVDADHSGRTCATYNDWDRIRTVVIDGHKVTLGSNIAVSNIGYTLGMATEWLFMCLEGKIKASEIVQWNGAFKNYG